MTPVEIRQQRYKALVKALDFTEMVRFIQQFDNGSGNYTEERFSWLDSSNLDNIFTEIRQTKT